MTNTFLLDEGDVVQPVGELPEGPPLLQLDVGVSHDCFCKANTCQSTLWIRWRRKTAAST